MAPGSTRNPVPAQPGGAPSLASGLSPDSPAARLHLRDRIRTTGLAHAGAHAGRVAAKGSGSASGAWLSAASIARAMVLARSTSLSETITETRFETGSSPIAPVR